MPTKVQNFLHEKPVLVETNSRPLGIYIHIPFCRSKCSYCAFNSRSPLSDTEMDCYQEALIRHIRSSSLLADNRKISSLFIGGGTPSLFGSDRLARLFETLTETFHYESDAEFTLEANPEGASLELFRTLHSLGVNRISLGAQSFQADELKLLGRIHSKEKIVHAVEVVRAAGIDNLSLDLIFAVPHQTQSSWENTLQKALQYSPDHISAYGLTYEEGTPLYVRREKDLLIPVSEDAYVGMYQILQTTLGSNGFCQYEISNWSRPGKACRHNQLYWNRDEYLAFGVSAAGWYKGTRYTWKSEIPEYIQYWETTSADALNSLFPIDRLEEYSVPTQAEIAADAMIFGLRLTEGINLDHFVRRYGFHPQDRWGEPIRRLQNQGWLEQKNGYLRLTSQAFLISNEVLQYFVE